MSVKAYEFFLALLIDDEEEAIENTVTAMQERKKDQHNTGTHKREAPDQDLKCAAPIKTEHPQHKKPKRGSKNTEAYLMKGGLMAFYDLSDFSVHFGMTRTQVEQLVTLLEPFYMCERGSKLPLENIVLASLWVLASQESYRAISERFQTSKSVICTSLHNFCSLVSRNLEHHISWPSGGKIRKTVQGFEARGFPGTVGAMGTCRVPISKPKDVPEPDVYMYEKAVYATILLVACDHECRFTYVNVGHPGRFSDEMVFNRCELYGAFEADPHTLLPLEFQLNDTCYPYHIIADSSFPLSEYVMTPYQNSPLHPKQAEYNKRHFAAMTTISKAIGTLKGRFKRLRLLLMHHLAQCSVAIKACCILHNICTENEDMEESIDINIGGLLSGASEACRVSSQSGEKKRDVICDSFF